MRRLTSAAFLLFFPAIVLAGPYPGNSVANHGHTASGDGGILANPNITNVFVRQGLQAGVTVQAPLGIFGNLVSTVSTTLNGVIFSTSGANVPPNFNLVQNGNFTYWINTASGTSGKTDIAYWVQGAGMTATKYNVSRDGNNAPFDLTLDTSGPYGLFFIGKSAVNNGENFTETQTIPYYQGYFGKTLYLRVRGACTPEADGEITAQISDGTQTKSSIAIKSSTNMNTFQTLIATITVANNASSLSVTISYNHASGGLSTTGSFKIASVVVTEGVPIPFKADPVLPIFPATTIDASTPPGLFFEGGCGIAHDNAGISIYMRCPDSVSTTPSYVNGISVSSTGVRVKGTIVAANANAGDYGEYISSQAIATVASNNTYVNIAQVNITAGDWSCNGGAISEAGTTVTRIITSISLFSGNTTTDQVAGVNSFDGDINAAVGGNVGNVSISPWRVLTATSATVYIKTRASYAASAPLLDGYVACRRTR